ncbi:MAG: aldehyde dehydrogenase family protein [Deltaproteobacteria bacterium]|jgi:succinate-semialdehyde dehydrogenase|nr:aldehyde dehydrogenase family protein [Deltaproteobacteria bacterium]
MPKMENVKENGDGKTRLVKDLVERARAAQRVFQDFTQEAVDAAARALGKAIFDNAESLAREAVAETGMGDVEAKIRKQRGVAMSHWDFVKNKPSVGIIENDPASLVAVYAKPMGVIACISPTTNPTSTVCGNGVYALKARNAIIVAPHPRAKKVTARGVALIREALEKVGAPRDLAQVIDEPSIDLTQALMAECDATIATGGPGMVKSAYSSGRPSFGVGPGNVQSFVDRGARELYPAYAEGTIRCRTTDIGVQCTAEQTMHLPVEEKDRILSEFVKRGAVIVEDEETIERIRRSLFIPESGALNVKMVGKPVGVLAKEFGLSVPEDAAVLVVKGKGPAPEEILCREKLCPVVTYLTYDDFEDGARTALKNLECEGSGHSAVLFSNDEKHIDFIARLWPVSRLSVNTANSMAGGNTPLIGLKPTMSLGCGTWGNNSVSENITYRHLMNTTMVARVIPGAEYYDPEKVWA